MHPVLLYLIAVAALSATSGVGLFIINQAYSRQNIYPNIEKSEWDSKNYKIFTLPNQIHVLMITSNITEISAISIKSETGFMIDPPQFQGMCNYIQNLLSTSQKYPQEDLMRRFLFLNSGMEQRSCKEMESQYYWEIQNDAFYQTLDLASHLFVSPYITKQSMDRTLQNMHLKWKNKESVEYLLQLAAKQRSPLGQFYSGNLQTLFEEPEQNEKNPYIEALKFFRAKYSANRLSVVVYTHENMKKRVTELLFEYFSEVIDKQLTTPSFRQLGLPLKNQRFFYVQNQYRELRILFDFDVELNFQTKSLQFIVDMLMNQLKFCEEQVNAHQAFNCRYSLKEIPKEFAVLEIRIELPKSGKVEIILRELYKRINFLKKQKLEQQWEKLFELQLLNTNYSQWDINNIVEYSSILKSTFNKELIYKDCYKKYDEESNNKILEQLDPKNMTIIYLDNFYESYEDKSNLQLKQQFITIKQQEIPKQKKVRKIYVGKVKKRVRKEIQEGEITIDEDGEEQSQQQDMAAEEEIENNTEEIDEIDEIEEQILITDFDYDITKVIKTPIQADFEFNQLFGLHYYEAGILGSSLKELGNIIDKFEFKTIKPIPKNLEIIENPNQAEVNQKKQKKQIFKYPELLQSSSGGNLWHVYDTTNNVPQVSLKILIRFIDFQNDDDNFMAIQLLKLNFKESISYVGSIQMIVQESQFEIIIVCFSDQLKEVIKEVKDNLDSAYQITKQFDWLMDNLKNNLERNASTTMQQVLIKLKSILTPTPQFKELKADQIQQKLNKLKIKQRWEVLLYGNIDSSTAKSLYNVIIPKPTQGSKEFYQEEIYKLSKKPIVYRLAKLQSQSVVTLNLYQGSENNLAQYVYFRVLQKLMKIQIDDYLFNQLQLGFIVDVQLMTINHVDSLVILVQSSNYDPEEIDFYIEESLGYFETFLTKLSDRDFQIVKESLQKLYQQIPNTVDQQAEIVWKQIRNGSYYFTQRECTVIALDKIQKNELIKFFLIHFKARNSKLSLQLYKQGSQIPREILREQDTYAHKMSDLVTNQEEFQNIIKETYKYKAKYITETPPRVC